MISQLATLTEMNTLASTFLVFLQRYSDMQTERPFGHFLVFCQCLKAIEASVYSVFFTKV